MMRRLIVFGCLAAFLGTVVMAFVGGARLGAQAVPSPQGIPRMPDGKPDFSGFWEHPQRPGAPFGATVFDEAKMAPFVPGGEALFYEPRTGDPRHDEPRAFCMPSGFPSNLFGPYPVQMVQNAGWLVMVHEYDRMTRLIPLDGRPHRTAIEPTFYGDPVGRWEGDTLVIESRTFRRWSLDDYYYQDPTKYRMHSEALRTIERMRFADPETIAYEITVDDPEIFTRPWSEDFVMKARPDWEPVGLYEFVCQENNRCAGGQCEP
jgi:hypothetical protein